MENLEGLKIEGLEWRTGLEEGGSKEGRKSSIFGKKEEEEESRLSEAVPILRQRYVHYEVQAHFK